MFRTKKRKEAAKMPIERTKPLLGDKDVGASLQELVSKQQHSMWCQITEATTSLYQQAKRDLVGATDEQANTLASQIFTYREEATRHALQDAHAAEQLCNQLHPLVASIESQLLQSEQRLFSQLDGMLTDYFLQMQQLCRSYTQQQGVLDAGRATDAELEHYTTLNRTVVRQEKEYFATLMARRAEELVHWLRETEERVATTIQAAGTLEDSASALHGSPEQELEACSLPELLPNGDDGSLIDGSITDILEPSVVESSGVGSRVSGTAPGRDAAVARMQTWRRSVASPVPEGAAEGSAEASGEGAEEDVDDGTISDILSSHMSELTLSSTSSRHRAGSAMSVDVRCAGA